MQHLIDDGCANEDGREWSLLLRLSLAEEGQVYMFHETLELTPEMVPMHLDIETPDEFLAAPFRGAGLLTE